jgi:hypothetical protein
LQDVLNCENGANILSRLIDACPGAIDYTHQFGHHEGLNWCWKTLLHLAIPEYLTETDDASTRFDIELDSLVSFLMMRKPELAGAIDEQLRTPLHLACASLCSVSTVKQILECLSEEQVMACDSMGQNALHYAMSANFEHPDRLGIVGELLHASYDLIYQVAEDLVCIPDRSLLANASVEETIGLVQCFQSMFVHGPHSHMTTRSGSLILHAALYQ